MKIHNLILGTFFLLMIVANVDAASLDCGKASTRLEELICQDPEFSELDSWMSGIYEQALTRTHEPSQLKEQQQRWLRDTRNRCSDPCCLKSAYTQRIEQLSAMSVWMTNEKEQKICKAVVDAINDGSIVRHIKEFELASWEDKDAWADSRPANFESMDRTLKIQAHGKPFTLGWVTSGGSCNKCEIEDINARVKGIYPPDDEKELFRSTEWGKCDYFLFIEGEPIIVTGRLDGGESRASFVAWLAPDGAKRALCHLGRSGNTKKTLITNNNPELCDAVLKGQMEKIPWSTSFSIPRDGVNDATLWDSNRDATLDINLDGKQETIVLFDYASGAGCGYYRQWLREFTPQQRSVSYKRSQSSTETPLNEIFADSGDGPIKNTEEDDDWFTVQLFRYAGKPYILGGGSDGKSNAEVFSVWGNQYKCWCEYQVLPQHKVEVYYPVETWPAPALEMSEFEQIKGAQALHNAVEANNREEVLRLIKSGTPVDVADDSGWTPLGRAVLYRRMDLAKLLLQHGAAVDGVSNGKPPLLLAVRHARDNAEMVKLLLDWKADPNVRENGQTALSIAQAMSKHYNRMMDPYPDERMKQLVDLLIRAGAKE